MTQNKLCRMRNGWCRDCESSTYHPECEVESPDVPKEQPTVMEKARVVAALHTYEKYNLFPSQVANIQADLREMYYQGYEFSKKELAELRAERDKLQKELYRIECHASHGSSVGAVTIKGRLFYTADVIDAKYKHLEADNERLKSLYEASEVNVKTNIQIAKDLQLEVDKLKENIFGKMITRNKDLWQDNEKLRVELGIAKMLEYSEDDLQKLKDNHSELFTSELQRRWPSEEEIEQAGVDKTVLNQEFNGFITGVKWLKYYLENK